MVPDAPEKIPDPPVTVPATFPVVKLTVKLPSSGFL
jgi:hypothetical protein